MSDIALDPLCSGSLRSRVEGCDTYDSKTERDLCTMNLMNCTDRPSQQPQKEMSACELCGYNNNCNHFPTVGLRDECLRKYCDSTGNCDNTFPEKTSPPTNVSAARLSLIEAYQNPFSYS